MKNFRKFYAVLMLVSFVFASVSPAFAAGIAEGWRAAFWDDASDTYKVGSTADFLGYNWKLWKTDGTYACVITTGAIRNSQFNDVYDVWSNYYPNSTIRGVINGYENNMKGYSCSGNGSGTKLLTWDEINGEGANFIAYSPTDSNGVGTDHLYLLSDSEAKSMPANIRAIGTEWVLRSPCPDTGGSVRVVGEGGDIKNTYTSTEKGVRPALIINLKSLLFASTLFRTAPSGKADVNAGDGFSLKDYDGADGWKRTVPDKNIKTPKVILAADGDKKIAIHYTAESAGENMYLSALLYDTKGNLINYAKIAKTAAKTKGIAAAELPLDNLPVGEYKVRFFSEQINGEGKYDYASELTEEFDIAKPYFFKTAPNGKTEVKVGEGFTLAPYDGSNGWKMTVHDENIAAPNAINLNMNGDTLGVFCAGETEIGEDRYLSALLYDENGEIINYAKVAEITKRSIALIKGKWIYLNAKMPLGNLKPGNYKIRFFYEQIKGAGESDIASNRTKEYDLRIPAKAQLNTAVLQNANAVTGNTSLNSVKVVSQENSVALLDEDYVGVSGVKETKLKDGLDIMLTYDGEKADSETAQFKIKLDKPIKLAEGRQLAVFIPLPSGKEEESENPVNDLVTLAVPNIGKDASPENALAALAIPNIGKYEENEYLVLKDEDLADDMVTFTVPNVGKYFESGETVPVTLAEINGDAKFDGEEEQKKSSSSGGCNAGFGILALLCAAPMIFRKKH